MARATGVSVATLQRVWHTRGLKPHLVETFKLSNDRRSRNSWWTWSASTSTRRTKAVVLCLDEKSQIRALDRTQPSLPMERGRAGTMTDD
jgi:hypothetical protein